MARYLRHDTRGDIDRHHEGGKFMLETVSPTLPGVIIQMGRKRADESEKDLPKQVNFKPSPRLMERLVETAKALELDLANLARMIISENLYIYERRAKEAQRGPGAVSVREGAT